jgi:hypothetical protein
MVSMANGVRGRTDLVWHPRALDFEIPTSHPADEGSEVGLRVNHLDDIGYIHKYVHENGPRRRSSGYLWSYQGLQESKRGRQTDVRAVDGTGITLPDTGPEDIAVVDVHHDPLAIERILIDRSARGIDSGQGSVREASTRMLTCIPWCRYW